jgi:hypothetical protein
MLTTHPLLVPRLRNSRSYTSCHPDAPLWSVTGPLFYLWFYNKQTRDGEPKKVGETKVLFRRIQTYIPVKSWSHLLTPWLQSDVYGRVGQNVHASYYCCVCSFINKSSGWFSFLFQHSPRFITTACFLSLLVYFYVLYKRIMYENTDLAMCWLYSGPASFSDPCPKYFSLHIPCLQLIVIQFCRCRATRGSHLHFGSRCVTFWFCSPSADAAVW